MKNFLQVSLVSLAFAAVSCAPAAKNESAAKAPTFTAFLAIDEASGAKTSATSDCNEKCQKLRQEFRYVVYVGKQIYCYWDEKRADTKGDFDALAVQLEQGITNVTTPTDYYLALRTWASAFHDGHVNVLLKADHSDIEIYSAPVRLEVMAPATEREKIVVVEAKPETELKVGDVVVSISGVSAKEALDKAELQVSGSTQRMRRFFATRRLVDVLGIAAGSQPLELVVKRGEDVTLSVALPRMPEVAPKLSGGGESNSTGAELIKSVILPSGLGYLRIDGFSGSQSFFLLEQAIERLSKTKGLVIDLRKNGGGDQSGNSIIAHLIKTPVTRYRTSERMNDYVLANRPEYAFLAWTQGAPYADWHDLKVQPKQQAGYLDKPVVALISPNCFSACDTFTAALKANGLATVAGEGSGGGTGSPLVFDLPVSSHSFRYSVVKGLTAKGETIEGAGTLPDVVIEPAIADRIAGKDAQLQKALELLGTKAGLGEAKIPTAALEGMKAVSQTLEPIWKQELDRSPTMADERALRAISKIDEAL